MTQFHKILGQNDEAVTFYIQKVLKNTYLAIIQHHFRNRWGDCDRISRLVRY